MIVGFDVISDLNLQPNDSFNWQDKSTSLYCIVAGNISSDIETVRQVLLHLSTCYQAVLYMPGHLEYTDAQKIRSRHTELGKICRELNGVVFMHNHVVVIDNIALLGVVGWYDREWGENELIGEITGIRQRQNDCEYLKTTISRLNAHDELLHLVVITSCVPDQQLYFGQHPIRSYNDIDLAYALQHINAGKIQYWVYGNNDKTAEIKIGTVTYVNNAYCGRKPYWPKRIEVGV